MKDFDLGAGNICEDSRGPWYINICATPMQMPMPMPMQQLSFFSAFKWFTADEMYGNNRRLRVWLEQQQIWHVVVRAFHQYVWLPIMRQTTVQQLADTAKADD